jgi:hypothetical protein
MAKRAITCLRALRRVCAARRLDHNLGLHPAALFPGGCLLPPRPPSQTASQALPATVRSRCWRDGEPCWSSSSTSPWAPASCPGVDPTSSPSGCWPTCWRPTGRPSCSTTPAPTSVPAPPSIRPSPRPRSPDPSRGRPRSCSPACASASKGKGVRRRRTVRLRRHPPPLTGDWLAQPLVTLAGGDRPGVRLVLLAALAPYRITDADVATWRPTHPGDADLVGVPAYGAMTAVDRIQVWTTTSAGRRPIGAPPPSDRPRHRRGARPPRSRKSRSASDGAMAAARW